MLEGAVTAIFSFTALFGGLPSSSTYQLQTYGIGSGGTNNSSSPSYRLNGSSGETGGTSNGGTTTSKTGSTESRQANVPLLPTLDNGSDTYTNKLNAIINRGGPDAADYTYSIAVSTNNFSTTSFVQADGTLGGAPFYQSYIAWGGATGSLIIGLTPGTTYQVKMNAMQPGFTGSAYGPQAVSTTTTAALNFSITPSVVTFGSLLPGVTTNGNTNVTVNFSTSSAGGAVYIAGANAGLRSASANFTIPAVNNSLASLSEGFGMQGASAGQTSGGPFMFVSPFNGTASTVGAPTASFKQLLTTSVALVDGTAQVQAKARAATSTASATDYSETLTFVASASY